MLRVEFSLIVLILALVEITAQRARATGFYGPFVYLRNGGTAILGTPEFYWEEEVKRLARQFQPAEKFVPLPQSARDAAFSGADVHGGDTEKPWMRERKKATADADIADFAEALKAGRINPSDQAEAIRQHDEVRAFLSTMREGSTDPLPAEFDSEFADYHKGAAAYLRGREHWDEARQAWEKLLERPEAERHHRSVWAAFMLGKIALKSGSPDAPKWLQMTRQLAKDGYADSLGMAADSYGWEGRSEYKQDHPEKAAQLFLTQLAAGDESAIVSLKALVPDRASVYSMLNYGPEDEEVRAMTDEQKRAEEKKTMAALRRAAADPLLRRLVTAHVLCTASGDEYYTGFEGDSVDGRQRIARWMEVINESKTGKVEDAEYLGWLAYKNGSYKQAARWLQMADAKAPASCWLRAKLELREGRNADAAKSLSEALAAVRKPAEYTGWKSPDGSSGEEGGEYVMASEGGWTLSERAGGELAQIQLSLNDFTQALDTFMDAQLWEDAAYVAERVLTCDELKAYVDKLPSSAPEGNESNVDVAGLSDADRRNSLQEKEDTKGYQIERLRHLLGRKLVRANRMEEAKAYLPAPYNKVLERYIAARQEAENAKLPESDRAKAWSTAAWIARYDGMELMGTEVAPDGFVSDGSFPSDEVAKPRLTGRYKVDDYMSSPSKVVTGELPLPATGEEKKRIQQNKIEPDLRFHYRSLAAEMAMNAAKLMPDNTEELADAINTAGGWVKERDEKRANQYYNVLERRCGGTEIGKQVLAKHWFVDEPGPWSAEQESDFAAMHSELFSSTQ